MNGTARAFVQQTTNGKCPTGNKQQQQQQQRQRRLSLGLVFGLGLSLGVAQNKKGNNFISHSDQTHVRLPSTPLHSTPSPSIVHAPVRLWPVRVLRVFFFLLFSTFSSSFLRICRILVASYVWHFKRLLETLSTWPELMNIRELPRSPVPARIQLHVPQTAVRRQLAAVIKCGPLLPRLVLCAVRGFSGAPIYQHNWWHRLVTNFCVETNGVAQCTNRRLIKYLLRPARLWQLIWPNESTSW